MLWKDLGSKGVAKDKWYRALEELVSKSKRFWVLYTTQIASQH
jgi:hypothetical protein